MSSEFQGHPQLNSKYKASLSYMRLYLKDGKNIKCIWGYWQFLIKANQSFLKFLLAGVLPRQRAKEPIEPPFTVLWSHSITELWLSFFFLKPIKVFVLQLLTIFKPIKLAMGKNTTFTRDEGVVINIRDVKFSLPIRKSSFTNYSSG